MKNSVFFGALIALSFAFAHGPVLAMGDSGSSDTSGYATTAPASDSPKEGIGPLLDALQPAIALACE